MKSKCKPIDLSKRDKIKATVSYLIFCYLFVFSCIYILIRDYIKNHLSDDIVWIILLFIAVVIITIIFIRDLEAVLNCLFEGLRVKNFSFDRFFQGR